MLWKTLQKMSRNDQSAHDRCPDGNELVEVAAEDGNERGRSDLQHEHAQIQQAIYLMAQPSNSRTRARMHRSKRIVYVHIRHKRLRLDVWGNVLGFLEHSGR